MKYADFTVGGFAGIQVDHPPHMLYFDNAAEGDAFVKAGYLYLDAHTDKWLLSSHVERWLRTSVGQSPTDWLFKPSYAYVNSQFFFAQRESAMLFKLTWSPP